MSFNKTKCDPELGLRVHEHLVKCGVETPTISNNLSRTDKIEIIERKFKDIMETLGLDLSDDSLIETPKRVAKMYVGEIFWGLDYEAFPKCTTVDNKMKYDEMVVERNVNVQSNCEHHFVVIDGVATVAYIPKQRSWVSPRSIAWSSTSASVLRSKSDSLSKSITPCSTS